MSSETQLQGLRAFSSSNVASRSDSRSGYGGISDKISRLNDILRSLETRRSTNTVITYDSPENGYPSTSPTWPPLLYNSTRSLDTKAALERSGAANHLPNTFSRTGDGINESTHGDSWDIHHRGSVLGRFSSQTDRGSMLGTFKRSGPCGMMESLSARPPDVSIHMHDIMRRRPVTSSSLLNPLSRQQHTRDSAMSTPEIDVCAHPSCHRCNGDQYGTGYDYMCHASPNGYLSAHQPLEERTRSTHLMMQPDSSAAHSSSFPNMVNVAHAILARLERLETQQRTTRHKTPKLHRLSKKGGACKLGFDQKGLGQKKSNFGEKGLLQMVRRRVNGELPHACGDQDSPKCKEHISKNGDQEIEKRFQRLENELEDIALLRVGAGLSTLGFPGHERPASLGSM